MRSDKQYLYGEENPNDWLIEEYVDKLRHGIYHCRINENGVVCTFYFDIQEGETIHYTYED